MSPQPDFPENTAQNSADGTDVPQESPETESSEVTLAIAPEPIGVGGEPVGDPPGNAIERAFGLTVRDQGVLAGLGMIVILLSSVHLWRMRGPHRPPLVVERGTFREEPSVRSNDLPVERADAAQPTESSPDPRSDRSPTASAPVTVAVRRPTLYLIDINTADRTDWSELPGVGEVLAERIINHREAIGRFDSVEDLRDVRGVGAKTLDKMRPYLICE